MQHGRADTMQAAVGWAAGSTTNRGSRRPNAAEIFFQQALLEYRNLQASISGHKAEKMNLMLDFSFVG